MQSILELRIVLDEASSDDTRAEVREKTLNEEDAASLSAHLLFCYQKR